MKSELFKDFSAVKNKQVYELSSELFSRQGNSLVEALTDMIEIMYPSVSINPEDPTKRTESSKAETSKAETSKTETSKAETSKAETSKAETSKATTSKVKADTSLKITKDMFFEFGDIKDDIKKVQNRLEALGYFNEEKSGYYGEVTQKAVKAFQKANKLTQSGNCDYKTLTLMFSAKAKAAR